MTEKQVWYSANVWTDFPTLDEIIESCAKARLGRFGGGLCINISGKPRFWVNFGKDSFIRGVGRTQLHVAGIVNADSASVFRVPKVYLGFSKWGRGYIVMDFIEGMTSAQRQSDGGKFQERDIIAVADAVRQLTNI